MPNRIESTFSKAESEGRAAFIAYVCAGDPNLELSLEIVKGLDRAGVDLIELGLPFSDPLADGIVNQEAAARAINAGSTTRGVLELIRKFREESETPVVLYTYLNNTYMYGYDEFQRDAVAVGVDGILNLDLPPDEAPHNSELEAFKELRQIRLIAPTTPEDRIGLIAQKAEGFIYYVSQEGVTGARAELATGIAEQVAKIKENSDVPVAVGFGISTPAHVAHVAAAADGVVVGSAIVRIIADNAEDPAVADKVHDFVKPLVEATKRA